MQEVNDFNAVQITLASPEKIRGWSYGEVTKPETINYRTLKPEKDGLFCERIFGPTKDWECHCGKYKRVRYKGITCDKCGVEVARAKVRRERMGHIELASSVSHIWFVKGTPSRVGLLLDMSPRSLERVIYFAQYLAIDVDEEIRAKAAEQLEADLEAATKHVQAHASTDLEVYGQHLKEPLEDQKRELQERLNAETNRLVTSAKELETTLEAFLGSAAPQTFQFEGSVIVQEDAAVTQDSLVRLRELTQQHIEQHEQAIQQETEDKDLLVDSAIEQRREEMRSKAQAEIDRLRSTYDTMRKELDTVKRLQLWPESRYREVRQLCLDFDKALRPTIGADTFKPAGPRVDMSKFYKAGMGADAVRQVLAAIDLDKLADDLRHEIRVSSSAGQKRKKATKRLRVVESFRRSNTKPEWMIITVLPVLPPDLRPMVQLDGGRFATSDLNDLYRRVINRNNRLRRLQELGAPEIIVRNEKRMLQEAVDSLIDNGRRGRAVSGSGNHKLKSLSDMLKGKQGRFRQNLLGKRVDYSGRSVIVVGPSLKLHECGLPKRMALELFKPFVMRRLVELGYAHNIKSAKRAVEKSRPEVWEVLEEVTKDHPVLLNRAPTLHRLGIQAFQPVLIDGSAIQLHPLVCSAFNADFDGDQMAVHVPLGRNAIWEAQNIMLSSANLLSPASGEPTVAPTLDMVLGCYALTVMNQSAKGAGMKFADPQDAKLAYDLEHVNLNAPVLVRMPADGDGQETKMVETTVGRLVFNGILPEELGYRNQVFDRKALRVLVSEVYRRFGPQRTAEIADSIKNVGFEYATRSGTTISIRDIQIPKERDRLLAEADSMIRDIDSQLNNGLITEEERYKQAVEVWTKTTDDVTTAVRGGMDPKGPVYMMTTSGTKGNIQQIRQMAGMRGLMTDPTGKIIDLPIRSNFREGLTVLEYFISTHGARKGLADTAIRTADSGYLTRRLVDVAQDVIIQEEDCGTTSGIWIERLPEGSVGDPFVDRITGRMAAMLVADAETGEVLVDRNEPMDEAMAKRIGQAHVDRVLVRSPLSCESRFGVCQHCYGRSLARGRAVDMGEAVGIIAAQSIGEPGTQLTMRTFHTGGIAGLDITSGLPRVEELFEARVPKGQAIVSEIDGIVEVLRTEESRRVRVVSQQIYTDEQEIPVGYDLKVAQEDWVEIGSVLAEKEDEEAVISRMAGRVTVADECVTIVYEDREEREYEVPSSARLRVETGQRVLAGDLLTDGSANPQDILRIMGREAVQKYLVEEVQRVYRTQGVSIHDKHIEVIVRQMLRKVKVDTPGDTELTPGDLVLRFVYEDVNAKVLAEGGEPATAQTVLLGVTKASLNTESFLAAASFQETTRVLTDAAIDGRKDFLRGLKENVIIGKLIPAGTGIKRTKEKTIDDFFSEPLPAFSDSPVITVEPSPAIDISE